MERDTKQIQPITKEQILTLTNRQKLNLSATNKIVSLKSDLIQLDTAFGGVIISGSNLELVKLDDSTSNCEITGEISTIKYIEGKSKEPFFRKLFK